MITVLYIHDFDISDLRGEARGDVVPDVVESNAGAVGGVGVSVGDSSAVDLPCVLEEGLHVVVERVPRAGVEVTDNDDRGFRVFRDDVGSHPRNELIHFGLSGRRDGVVDVSCDEPQGIAVQTSGLGLDGKQSTLLSTRVVVEQVLGINDPLGCSGSDTVLTSAPREGHDEAGAEACGISNDLLHYTVAPGIYTLHDFIISGVISPRHQLSLLSRVAYASVRDAALQIVGHEVEGRAR